MRLVTSATSALVSRVVNHTHSLQDGDGEGGGLSGTRLSLGNAVSASDDGHDGSLLDSGRSLETVSVDTSEEVGLELHVVEAGVSIAPCPRFL